MLEYVGRCKLLVAFARFWTRLVFGSRVGYKTLSCAVAASITSSRTWSTTEKKSTFKLQNSTEISLLNLQLSYFKSNFTRKKNTWKLKITSFRVRIWLGFRHPEAQWCHQADDVIAKNRYHGAKKIDSPGWLVDSPVCPDGIKDMFFCYLMVGDKSLC